MQLWVGLFSSYEARVKISASNSTKSRGKSLPAISCGSRRAQLVLSLRFFFSGFRARVVVLCRRPSVSRGVLPRFSFPVSQFLSFTFNHSITRSLSQSETASLLFVPCPARIWFRRLSYSARLFFTIYLFGRPPSPCVCAVCVYTCCLCVACASLRLHLGSLRNGINSEYGRHSQSASHRAYATFCRLRLMSDHPS